MTSKYPIKDYKSHEETPLCNWTFSIRKTKAVYAEADIILCSDSPILGTDGDTNETAFAAALVVTRSLVHSHCNHLCTFVFWLVSEGHRP